MINSILEIQPGDILVEIATARERTVVDVRLDMGLVAFEDSHLTGWSSLQGFAPTGRRAEGK